jgi:hypothetical protein
MCWFHRARAWRINIAYAIAGKDASGAVLDHALIVAECELTLRRIRRARVAAIEQKIPDASTQLGTSAEIAHAFVQALPSLSAMERYERRAYSRRKKALAHLHDLQQIARLKL